MAKVMHWDRLSGSGAGSAMHYDAGLEIRERNALVLPLLLPPAQPQMMAFDPLAVNLDKHRYPMEAIYHVRIKKDYAEAVIKGLAEMEAVELVEEDDNDEIPLWQQEEVLRRIAARKADPSLLVSREEAEAAIHAMGK